MEKVKIKLIEGREFARVPQKAHADDVGHDAFVSQINIGPDGLIKYKLGFATEMPSSLRGIIAARSSLTKTGFCVQNGHGVVDPGYVGEWEFRLRPINPGTQTPGLQGDTLGGYSRRNLPYNIGDACCQVYFENNIDVEFEHAEELSETERGTGGFGHTNKKIYGQN